MKAGSMIMANIPLWFAAGIGFGLSKNKKDGQHLLVFFMLMVVNNSINVLLSLDGITPETATQDGLMALGYTAQEAMTRVPMFKSVGGIFYL